MSSRVSAILVKMLLAWQVTGCQAITLPLTVVDCFHQQIRPFY